MPAGVGPQFPLERGPVEPRHPLGSGRGTLVGGVVAVVWPVVGFALTAYSSSAEATSLRSSDRGTALRGARAEALTRIATHNTIASANFHACVVGTIIDSPTMITRKRREIKCGELVGGPQTSSPWRMVFSVTARGSTKWRR